MQTKPLDRLLFVQGGRCFFCRKALQKAEASVEHLIAVTNGGKDNDENCVACCKPLNALFGRMSLKEKLQIILNQKGDFRCPAGEAVAAAPVPKPATAKPAAKAPRTHAEKLALVVADLRKRDNTKPATIKKLVNTIRSQLVQHGEPGNDAESLLQELSTRSYVTVSGEKVTYHLPPKGG